MGRPRVLAVAGLLVVATALPAYAAEDRPPKVGRKALPATVGVAAVYPALTDGSRYITRGGRQLVAPVAADCVGTTLVARADRGTNATYYLADDRDPFEQGLEDPTVAGYRFASVAEAESVMAAMRGHAERCAGAHEDAEGHTATSSRLDDPALGDEALAVARTHTWPDSDDPDGPDGYHALDVMVRDGLSISRVQVKHAAGAPDPDRALALAELAWQRLV